MGAAVARRELERKLLAGVAIAGIAALSACAPKPVPAPPPPPRVAIPPMPYPPMGASPNLTVPPVDTAGVRRTINVGITDPQKTWNLRSAYNVAALNCMRPEHAQIVVNYRTFLKNNARKLTSVNEAIDRDFKARYGNSAYIRPREAYMTQVYNYFALPPTLPAFCDAALAISNEALTVKPADLDGFAAAGLARLDRVFLDFFNSYDQYRADLAAWEARYRPTSATTVSYAAPAAVSGSSSQ